MAHRKTHNSFFILFGRKLQHFYGFLCVTISLSYTARICKNGGYAIVYFRCFAPHRFPFGHTNTHPHAHQQEPFISPEESHKFSRRSISIRLCLLFAKACNFVCLCNVHAETGTYLGQHHHHRQQASRLRLGINYKQS